MYIHPNFAKFDSNLIIAVTQECLKKNNFEKIFPFIHVDDGSYAFDLQHVACVLPPFYTPPYYFYNYKKGEYALSFNPYVWTLFSSMTKIGLIAHEICHAISLTKHPNTINNPHGPEWQEVSRRAGFRPKTYIDGILKVTNERALMPILRLELSRKRM